MPEVPGPEEPLRLKRFARFFKNYMSVSAVVTAALPIPITSFGLIPTYKAQTHFLSVYASLYCFLLLGFIFYSRHQLARSMFPAFDSSDVPPWITRLLRLVVAGLPAMLILASLIFVYCYHVTLQNSLNDVTKNAAAAGFDQSFQSFSSIQLLETLDIRSIPSSGILIVFYLGIFLFAESAFILMAIKEYLQDLLHLSEVELITQIRPSSLQPSMVADANKTN